MSKEKTNEAPKVIYVDEDFRVLKAPPMYAEYTKYHSDAGVQELVDAITEYRKITRPSFCTEDDCGVCKNNRQRTERLEQALADFRKGQE